MKALKIATFALLATGISSMAFAQVSSVQGAVEYIRVHSADDTVWSPPKFWFTLKDVTTAGSCNKWNSRVIFAGDNTQALSVLLATQTADKTVQVRYNEAVRTDGYCRAISITTGNPPPSI